MTTALRGLLIAFERRKLLGMLLIVMLVSSCSKEVRKKQLVLKPGEFWPSRYDSIYLSALQLDSTCLYGSTVEISDSNYFYCLELTTGKVMWTIPVKSWATEPPVLADSIIYYSSHLGDIYAFSRQGKQLWQQKLPGSFSSHCLNPVTNHLIVQTVEMGVYEFSADDGQIKRMQPGRLGITLPVFINDKLFITAPSKDSTQITPDLLVAKDCRTGKLLWQTPAREVKRLFSHQNHLYYVDSSAHLLCLDGERFTPRWRSNSILALGPFPNIVFEKNYLICYGSDVNQMKVLDAFNGELLGTYSYEALVQQNLLTPQKLEWNIASSTQGVYRIQASNTPYTNHDFRSSFSVTVTKVN